MDNTAMPLLFSFNHTKLYGGEKICDNAASTNPEVSSIRISLIYCKTLLILIQLPH
jgi:hypothetical protein